MRAVVIGGSGQVGGWLLRELAARGHQAVGTYATVVFPGLVRLDAGDLDKASAWVREQRPDVVFYSAGFTWVDGSERDPARSHSANCVQPVNMARSVAEHGARFVNFSTDYVFDGMNGPYSENDAPNPLSVYGRSKLEAENRLAEALGDRLLNLRATWVFGPERQGKNFAYQLCRTLAARKEMVCPSDQFSSPSYGPDVARAAVALAERGVSGLVHLAGPEVMDRVAFAGRLATGFGLDPSLIVGKRTAELGQGAPRPLRSGLLTPRLDALLPAAIRPLANACADFLDRLSDDPSLARLLPPQ